MPAMVGWQAGRLADRKFSDSLPQLVGRFSDAWLKGECYRVVLSYLLLVCSGSGMYQRLMLGLKRVLWGCPIILVNI